MESTANDIHLALGGAAAARLRAAVARGLPGHVHAIEDDLGHGPLHDGHARIDWMRQCYVGGFEWKHIREDAFADWQSLADLLDAARNRVVIWSGDNVSETVLAGMACARLPQTELALVAVPRDALGFSHTATKSVGELLALQASARLLSDQERHAWTVDFERWREDGGLRRGFVGSRVATIRVDSFDELVTAACTLAWQPAQRVVASAMGAAQPWDGLSDVFLNSRLQGLVASGRIETDRPPSLLRDYAVRLS